MGTVLGQEHGKGFLMFAFLGALFGGLFSGAVGQFILKTIVQIAVNALVQAIIGKPKPPAFSLQGSLRSSGDEPRTFLVGTAMTAGSLAYANTWGTAGDTPNAYLTQVIALSDLAVDSLASVIVNGETVTLGGTPHASYGSPVTEYAVGGTDYLWVKFFDGTQTSADTFLTGTVSSTERPYQSTRVGTGIAYAIVTARINQELFNNSFPEFKFVVNGVKMYDPALDTTVGGSGSHRWATTSTWEYSENPMVQAYNLLRGLTYGGTWVYGLQGLASGRVPAADWIVEINKCKAQVANATGTEDRFRCSAEVSVDTEIGDAVEGILTSCSGRISEVGGIYKPLVAEVGSSVMSFTDGDIISTEEQSFTPFPGLADTINGVLATYPEPSEGWNSKAAPALYDATLEAEDGDRRLTAEIDLPMAPYGEQVQRLLQASLAEARRARRHTHTMPPEYSVLEPNDAVTFTSTRNGYSSKIFRVDGIVDQPNGFPLVDLTEVDPADQDWNRATDLQATTTSSIVVVRAPSQSVKTFAVSVVDIADSTATARRPGVNLTWDGTVDDVDGVMFEIRVKTTSVVVSRPTTMDFASASYITEQGLVAAETYQVRAKYIPGSARAVEWTAWTDFTTNDVRLGYDDLTTQLVTDIADAAKVPVVSSLPADETTKGRLVYLTTDKLLYRWDDSVPEWTTDVNATQIIGTLIAGQIGAGVIGASHMASDTASFYFASIGSLMVATANIIDGAITNAKISGTLESDTFTTGVAGWQLKQNGDAEVNNLTVREDMIADGAVTESVSDNVATYSLSTITYVKQAEITLTTTGKLAIINWQMDVKWISGTNRKVLWQIKDGTTVIFSGYVDLEVGAGFRMFSGNMSRIGAATYSFWIAHEGTGVTTVQDIYLTGQITKK
jgi:putative tail protein